MKIELLWWRGCPSTEKVSRQLRELMEELGLDPSSIVSVEITSEAEAESMFFIGSPTVRVNGRDVSPPPEDAVPAMTCRIYFRPDGSVSPTPELSDIKKALQASKEDDGSD